MTSTRYSTFADNWKEIASSLFKLGATSYGGPAIMGIMQAELQEKRKWVAKDQFLEGLAVANMLLCRRLLGWPASESGRLRHGDGASWLRSTDRASGATGLEVADEISVIA